MGVVGTVVSYGDDTFRADRLDEAGDVCVVSIAESVDKSGEVVLVGVASDGAGIYMSVMLVVFEELGMVVGNEGVK